MSSPDFVRCGWCGEVVPFGDVVVVRGEWVCCCCREMY